MLSVASFNMEPRKMKYVHKQNHISSYNSFKKLCSDHLQLISENKLKVYSL